MGVPLVVLSRSLGHRDASIALKVYSKAFRGRERIVAIVWHAARSGELGPELSPEIRDVDWGATSKQAKRAVK